VASSDSPSTTASTRSARPRTWRDDSSPVTYRAGVPPCASRAASWRSSVDLPIPGSPLNSTIDPGTRPPPRTRSTSVMPLASRSGIGGHGVARFNGGHQHRLGERVLDLVLEPATQRPRTACLVVALGDARVLGSIGHHQSHLLSGDLRLHPLQQQVHDLAELLPGELAEDDRGVDAVEELGAEDVLQLTQDTLLHPLVVHDGLRFRGRAAPPEANGLVLLDLGRADV